ncbi:hypothetical protein SDRG_06846 [Saprolegnia diclina VS20]|uniref:Uncharacterized protein n=1 Tax=Saprolegnia diclina (strain VS20) TaxID=1156394 RepID=T0QLH2_SAPDV|nr:hypothetical protein SDRG_06846 [Saprolegnia diclina VS20]EQC35556.1 hypothetical protein SDRG_06846 [Saprolegnia diclina VS20]|eukprot:XP_008610873.1 hypothetical protein SDRG_06846 [Saprolegnia diclina VS20]
MDFPAPFNAMANAQLLKAEQDLYTESCRAMTRSSMTAGVATVTGITTAGASAAVYIPFFVHQVNYSSNINTQLAECSAEVRRRGLESLDTAYGRIFFGAVLTCTGSIVGLVVPGSDLAADMWLAPAAEATAEAILVSRVGEAAIHAADRVVEALQNAVVVDTFCEIAGFDVVEKLHPFQNFLHDNEAVKAELTKRIEMQAISTPIATIEICAAPIHENLARRDVEAYVETITANQKKDERTKLTAAAVYAAPSVPSSGGVWSWVWGWVFYSSPVVTPGGVSGDISTMTETQVKAKIEDLQRCSVAQLRIVYDKVADTLTLSNMTNAQRLEKHLEAFVLARSLVLLHYDLDQCRTVGDGYLADETKTSSKCASVALIQAASAVSAAKPTQLDLLQWMEPNEVVATHMVQWRQLNLGVQEQRVKEQVEAKKRDTACHFGGARTA